MIGNLVSYEIGVNSYPGFFTRSDTDLYFTDFYFLAKEELVGILRDDH